MELMQAAGAWRAADRRFNPPREQGRLAFNQAQSDRGPPEISSRASRTAALNADVAFRMTEGGHVRRAKLNLGRERQDPRRVVCSWESSRSTNRLRALWIFPTLSSAEDSQKQLEPRGTPRRQKPELVTGMS